MMQLKRLTGAVAALACCFYLYVENISFFCLGFVFKRYFQVNL